MYIYNCTKKVLCIIYHNQPGAYVIKAPEPARFAVQRL